MAGAMHKMAVYLGLVEDDPHYDDGYDPYDEYDEYADTADQPEPELDRPSPRGSRAEFAAEPSPPACVPGRRHRHGDRACHRSRAYHHLAPAHVQ